MCHPTARETATRCTPDRPPRHRRTSAIILRNRPRVVSPARVQSLLFATADRECATGHVRSVAARNALGVRPVHRANARVKIVGSW